MIKTGGEMSRRLNILHIVCTLTMGGVEKILLSRLKHHDKSRFKFFIAYSHGGELEEAFKKEDVILYKFQNAEMRFRDFHGISIIYKLVKYIKQQNIDIIHTHLFVPYFFGTIAAKLTDIPIINHIHTEEFRRLLPTENHLKGIIRGHPVLNRLLLYGTDLTIATCQSTEKAFINLGIKKDKVALLHNGIDLPSLDYLNSLNLEAIKSEFKLSSKNIVCNIARLAKQKNQALFIRAIPGALKEFPDTQFLIVGDGPLKAELMELAKSLGVANNVIFTGTVPSAYPILAISDMFVLSSVWEQHPMTILEAMAMQKPVIAPKLAGIPDTVIDGKTGILLPPRDVDSLTKAILHLLRNKNEARKMGIKGKKLVQDKFSNKEVVRKIEQLYLEILNRRKRK